MSGEIDNESPDSRVDYWAVLTAATTATGNEKVWERIYLMYVCERIEGTERVQLHVYEYKGSEASTPQQEQDCERMRTKTCSDGCMVG